MNGYTGTYDLERYEQLMALAAEMAAAHSRADFDTVYDEMMNDKMMNDDTGAPVSEETLKRDAQALLAAVNAAYADGLDPEEEKFLRRMERKVWEWMRENGDEW